MARILSVDDDPDFQQLISLTLQSEGYEVHYAFTGREGYEKALLLNPDLILMDLMLPVLSGVEVIKLLFANKTAKSIPVIALTAYPTDANFVESAIRSMGAVEYLRKPCRIDDLVRLVRRMLAARRVRTEPNLRLEKGAVRIDPKYRSVWINDKMAAILPGRRFEVLFNLLQHKGEVPWRTLVENVWGKDGTRNDLEKTIQRLREDLGPEDAGRIVTTEGGYRLEG